MRSSADGVKAATREAHHCVAFTPEQMVDALL